MTETLLNQIDKLNEYLHLESDINKKDFKYIDTMLQSMRNEAIDYSRCCMGGAEQLQAYVEWKETTDIDLGAYTEKEQLGLYFDSL